MMNPDNFIFHSDLTPFAVTQEIEMTVTTGTSIAGNSTVSYYSGWFDVHGLNNAPLKTIVYPNGNINKNSIDHTLATNILATPDIQFEGNRIRGVVTVRKTNAGTGTYPQSTFKFIIPIVQVLEY